MENQNRIKTGLPKEQYITYHVPKNAGAALTFDTISKVHRLQIGTVAPIVLTGALPVLILLQAVEMAAQCIS